MSSSCSTPVAQELLGARELLGRPICEALPEIVAKGLAELLDHTYWCGEPYVDPPQCVLLERDGQLVECWFDVEYAPLREPGGGVDGLVMRAVEIIEQVRATMGPSSSRAAPGSCRSARRAPRRWLGRRLTRWRSRRRVRGRRT